MKIIFRGWNREIYRHEHPVTPVTQRGGSYSPGNSGEPIDWSSAKRAFGRVNGLSLGGDFLVEFEFESSELRNWLRHYVTDEPETAVRLLAEMQSEAAICLAQKAKSDALEEITRRSDELSKQ
jgi:hypothetical protein